jgi:hypothetical protein
MDRGPVPLVAPSLGTSVELFVPALFACMQRVTLFASSTAIVANGRAVSSKPNTAP